MLTKLAVRLKNKPVIMTPLERIKISIPCKADLDNMAPNSIGFYCAHCKKNVIDFRTRELSYLTKALEENKNVCGVFYKSQTRNNVNTNLLKRFAASFLITIGLGSFNKNLMAQAYSTDTLTHNHSIENETHNDFIVGGIDETIPTFKDGGDQGLRDFLIKNLKYPSDSVQGKVIVQYTVDTTGKTTGIKIVKGLSKLTDQEVIRVISLMEFVPGTRNGKKLPIRMTLPIIFTLDDKKSPNR